MVGNGYIGTGAITQRIKPDV